MSESGVLVRNILKKDETFDVEKFEEKVFDNGATFFGGYPVVKNGQAVFGSEFITPHKSPIANPIPLGMLKVTPGVEYKFLFVVDDYSTDSDTVTADEIIGLFKALLLLGGTGAKTNVGFGQFTDEEPIRYELLSARTMNGNKNTKETNNSFGNNTGVAPKCPQCGKPVTRTPDGRWYKLCSSCYRNLKR